MGEIKDAQNTTGVVRQTHIGGQALIEGIMMRGRYNWAVAVREPDGNIYTEEHDLASGRKKNRWMYWPIIRGCTAFVESLALGYKALQISGNHAYDLSTDEVYEKDSHGQPIIPPKPEAALDAANVADVADAAGASTAAPGVAGTASASTVAAAVADGGAATDVALDEGSKEDRASRKARKKAEREASGKKSKLDQKLDEPISQEKADSLSKGIMTFSMIMGLVIGIVVFIALPATITNLIMGDYGEHTFWWNVVDGFLRIFIFIAYIWGISRMKDIKRMFAYHGAEHQTIHCYEHDKELTPQNAAQFPRLHVRCGTAFLIMTMIIAIFVFTIVPVNAFIVAIGVTNSIAKLLLVILSRIVLMPLVAGLAYEVTVKWAGSHPENPFVKVVLWPGMQMQRITTNVPDEGMLECAIAAMKLVLAREELEAAKGTEPSAYARRPCDEASDVAAVAAEE